MTPFLSCPSAHGEAGGGGPLRRIESGSREVQERLATRQLRVCDCYAAAVGTGVAEGVLLSADLGGNQKVENGMPANVQGPQGQSATLMVHHLPSGLHLSRYSVWAASGAMARSNWRRASLIR
jgi:hypothetical protein